jgi:hypothetical protein
MPNMMAGMGQMPNAPSMSTQQLLRMWNCDPIPAGMEEWTEKLIKFFAGLHPLQLQMLKQTKLTPSAPQAQSQDVVMKQQTKKQPKSQASTAASSPNPVNLAPSSKPAKISQVKKPLSSFLIFMQQSRQRIMAENPGTSPSTIAQMAGEQWRKMSD